MVHKGHREESVLPLAFASHLLHPPLEAGALAESTLGHNPSSPCVWAARRRQAGHPGLGLLCPGDVGNNNKAVLFFNGC